MPPASPLLTVNHTILWLKVALTAATLGLLYFRYKKGKTSGASTDEYSLRTKALIVLAVLFSFGVFHNLGEFRGGHFIHYGEMFHYYCGSKYFKEVGYFELYNAVIAADAEQDNALARLPFYTDLKTYRNASRQTVLLDIDRVKNLFSRERWNAFKDDVSFFKNATDAQEFAGFLMDHGYNASPVSTFFLGMLTNAVPVTQLRPLAAVDIFLVAIMIALVFRTFGFEMGALFSVYFFVNILNDHDSISGSLLRYDWLLYIVAAVCLLESGRYAWSAFFLTLAAMLRVFPAVLFYGIAVAISRQVKATRALDEKSIRFILTAGVTALALFLLPSVSLGSILRPWKDFAAKAELHDSGVYVNHLGLRAIVLFEPSHLSLQRFAETFSSKHTNDIVRHWQDIKEYEYKEKKPAIVFFTLVVLVCVTAIIWKSKEGESANVLWPLLLIYTATYASHYYYSFLCLLVLLFFRRASLSAFVPLCLLLVFNIVALVTDSFRPSPIVFYTLINIYLFVCLSAILGFELYANVFGQRSLGTVASVSPRHEARHDVRRRRRKNARAHANRR
jgi:hypothetical protein